MSESAAPSIDVATQPRLGRYRIERFLARGGMAEVFVGKAEGPGGFEKNVVIKRILPELVAEDRFVRMFLAEARLAAQLNHPNIVQVFDFGQHDGMYFLAMEYIQGESLRAILQAYENQGRRLPPPICASLVAGVCEGLHYAHNLSDEHGVSRNLVHRDVTPDNILISASGVPKIVDFGIAKASSTGHRTEGGMLKGKYGYMSPEQIRGDGIDRRLDVYALGVTLYEMLAGHRPYVAENELQLLKKIIQAEAPRVEELVPEVPAALGAAVAQAIAPDPNLRFRDARALGNALQDYLASTGTRVAPFELAGVVNGVTAYHRERRAAHGTTEPPPRGVPGLELPPVDVDLSSIPKRMPRTNATISVVAPPTGFEPWRVRIPQAVGLIGFVALAIFGLSRLGPKPKPDPLPVATTLAPAVPVAVAPPRQPVPAPPPPHADEVAIPDPPPAAPTQPQKQVAPPGFLTVTSDPRCEIWVDAQKLGLTPLKHQEIPSGPHWLLARNREQGLERKTVIRIQPGAERFEKLVFGDGLLEVKVQPWANVFVDGRAYGQTPIQAISLPEGTHSLKVENPDLQRSETRTVHVATRGHEVVKIIW
ncbi:MAG: serine/threonine protein kinase [Deltaproteobacteria bacterium]|nr:serine/threonine protein kinase [Deltaproteobacteria bacterium]